MAIEWTPDLAVGVEEIDRQHQALFGAASALMESMQKGKGKRDVGEMLNFLESYIIKHFREEERVMNESAFPRYADHMDQHEAFVKSFMGLRKSFEAEGATVALVLKVNSVVCEWLRAHIMGSDKELGRHLAKKGIAFRAI